MPTKPKRPILTTVEQSEQSLVFPFTEEEYRKGIVTLKNNKAAGIDDILVEQLKHLGPRAHRWLHLMLNTCFTGFTENKIPKVWRQSRIIAILKPGKAPYACSPTIDGCVLTVVVRECIVVFDGVSAPRPILW